MSSSLSCGDSVTQPKAAHPAYLRREFVLNPITALAFFTSSTNGRLYLLVGEDNHIKAYDIETSVLCGELAVFLAQSIHGVAVSPKETVEQRVLVWGGSSVAVLPGEVLEALISIDTIGESLERRVIQTKMPDWIFDGILSPFETGDMVLLTAHNEVIKAQCVEHDGIIEIKDISSPSRPILYSGDLSWESKDFVLVAAGSVFGEILVWKYYVGSSKRNSSCEVLFVFSGHEGSIFGVHISSQFRFESGDTMTLLASCSDDRTIRVWDITDDSKASQGSPNQFRESIIAARQTGFGDSTAEASSQDEISSRCLAIAMGHISRIWQVEFPANQPLISSYSGIELWSFGEDATAQRWSISMDDLKSRPLPQNTTLPGIPVRNRWQLKNRAIISSHSGKQIWSHAIMHNASGELLIATGGADGKISLIGANHKSAIERDLSDINSGVFASNEVQTDPAALSGELNTASLASHPQGKTLPKKSKPKHKKESFRRYAFLSDGCLLAVTDAGRFFVGGSASNVSWKELSIPNQTSPAQFSYSVVKSSSTIQMAFVGTGRGDVFMYRDSGSLKLEHVTKVHGKVADMFILSSELSRAKPEASQETTFPIEDIQTSPTLLLVTVLGSTNASLFEIDISEGTVEWTNKDLVVDNGFVVTSAVLCTNYMILGSRKGFISVFLPGEDGVYRSTVSVEVSIDDTVTSITILPPKSHGAEGPTHFLATSRDGKYRIYSIRGTDANIEITLLHETSPPFGPMIEGAWFFTNQDASIDLILCGFRSKDFVVWNESQYREIATVDCGGGHRSLAYTPLANYPDGFQLAYTKATKLLFFSQTQAPHKILKTGGHGREIRAVSSAGNYIATAAEDTAIRIWSHGSQGNQKDSGLQCLAVMEKHTAGIQTMMWHEQSHLFSSGGNEEFFVWRVSHLDSDYKGLAVQCEAVFPDRTEDGDLRIMGFDVRFVENSSDGDPLFYISMGLSNSTLQSYSYSEKNGFRLIARGSYTGACLTQIRHLHVGSSIIQTLSTSTDGHLIIWEAVNFNAGSGSQASDFTKKIVTKLHQSSIKSLDINQLDIETGTSYLIVTGGDDNALGVLHIHMNRITAGYEVKSKFIVRSAHAAAVTGIAIVEISTQRREAIVASISNDQRVKKWKISDWQTSGGARVSLLGNQYSSVADAGDIEVLENGKLMVGGVGLEVWNPGSF